MGRLVRNACLLLVDRLACLARVVKEVVVWVVKLKGGSNCHSEVPEWSEWPLLSLLSMYLGWSTWSDCEKLT